MADTRRDEGRDATKEELAAVADAGALDRPVYVYVVATVRVRRGVFQQAGCSPNDKGGVITLCDCKHQMRASTRMGDPAGVWIAA